MDIIKRLYNKTLKINGITSHAKSKLYRELKLTPIYATFLVNRNHKNGLEYHYLLTNGKIVITNVNTNKLITILNARPQLHRYFIPQDDIYKSMIECAKVFKSNKLNI